MRAGAPGGSAIAALRQRLVAPLPGARWGLDPVRDERQIERCVALQASSLHNRGVEPGALLAPIRRRLTAGAARATDVLVVVDAPEGTVGFLWCSLRVVCSPRGEGVVCHVDSIVVDEPDRGRGLGGALMMHLETCARAAGFVAVTLNSMADNGRVARFYARLGYEVVGLDLEKSLRDSPPVRAEPGVARVGAVGEADARHAPPIRDAFEPIEDGRGCPSPDRFERDGVQVGLVGTEHRRATDGSALVVFDPWDLTPGIPESSVRGVVAELERAARAGGASRAYLTTWTPEDPVTATLLDLGYRVGRYKWWRSLGEGRGDEIVLPAREPIRDEGRRAAEEVIARHDDTFRDGRERTAGTG